MSKRVFSVIIAAVCAASLLTGAVSAVSVSKPEAERLDAVIISNGAELSMPSCRVKNALYLPLRACAEPLGLDVGWANGAATVTLEESTLTLPIGEENILIGGSTYVPVFFFTDVLGVSVSVSAWKIDIVSSNEKYTFYDRFGFENDAEGFEPLFADYHDDGNDLESYGMTWNHAEIPGAACKGMYIAASNRSDDLFMGFVKELSGLKENTEYAFRVSFRLATKVEAGMVGIGGAPGEAVTVKAGVASVYPKLESSENGVMRFTNIDIGCQSTGGRDLAAIGNMAKPEGSPEGFVFKQMRVECVAVTDAGGRAYLIIGTDSGFEGFTEYYIDDVAVWLS